MLSTEKMFTQLVAFFLQNYDESKMNFELNIRQYETENRNQFAKSCFFLLVCFPVALLFTHPPSPSLLFTLPSQFFFTIEWGATQRKFYIFSPQFFFYYRMWEATHRISASLLSILPPPLPLILVTPPSSTFSKLGMGVNWEGNKRGVQTVEGELG